MFSEAGDSEDEEEFMKTPSIKASSNGESVLPRPRLNGEPSLTHRVLHLSFQHVQQAGHSGLPFKGFLAFTRMRTTCNVIIAGLPGSLSCGCA